MVRRTGASGAVRNCRAIIAEQRIETRGPDPGAVRLCPTEIRWRTTARHAATKKRAAPDRLSATKGRGHLFCRHLV